MLNLSILMSTAFSMLVNAAPVFKAWATVKLASSSLCPDPPLVDILAISASIFFFFSSAGAANALPTAPPEGKAGVHLVLDLDEGVQHHGAAVVEVHLVLLHPGLVSRLFRVPSVDGEGLLLLRPQTPCSLFLGRSCL